MFLICEGLECRIGILKRTLSDEAVNRYQAADFCFPLCRNYRSIKQLTERIPGKDHYDTVYYRYGLHATSWRFSRMTWACLDVHS